MDWGPDWVRRSTTQGGVRARGMWSGQCPGPGVRDTFLLAGSPRNSCSLRTRASRPRGSGLLREGWRSPLPPSRVVPVAAPPSFCFRPGGPDKSGHDTLGGRGHSVPSASFLRKAGQTMAQTPSTPTQNGASYTGVNGEKPGPPQSRESGGLAGKLMEVRGEEGLASTFPPGELEVADGEAESWALEGGRPICELWLFSYSFIQSVY